MKIKTAKPSFPLQTTSSLIQMGRIGKTFGLRGGLKVNSHTDPASNLFHYSSWILETSQGQQTVHLCTHQPHEHHGVVHLEGYTDINAVQLWVGATIWIARDQLPPLAEREYYWTDLEGLTVIDQTGATLGTLDHLIATGANDVMVIKNTKEEILIPYLLDEVITSIALDQKTMHVQWE